METMGQQTPKAASEPQKQALILPFEALDRTLLPLAGGKAANLGEMTQAGLPVPPGFCVTTRAYALVAAQADLADTLAELSHTEAGDVETLKRLAAAARAILLAVPVPAEVREAITKAYQALTLTQADTHVGARDKLEPLAVAVRSSATAEDLPFASFAGQQDTYLNIVGAEEVLEAVRRCWASLWTDRAVSYRANNAIDHTTVRLAVAVQRMVEATVAGVLFTANPLTGHRHQAVIDANPGLGEAVVSGLVNPDHFVVDSASGEILERKLGDKQLVIQTTPGGGTHHLNRVEQSDKACLSDSQLQALARLGGQVEKYYQAPQDIEWAIDQAGQLWLTQSRPITTLFPLPDNAPPVQDNENLKVYFSFSVAQGVFRPFTPMGLAGMRMIGSSVAGLIGLPPRDPLAGPAVFGAAAGRLYVDVTPALRHPLGHKLAIEFTKIMEARTSAIFQSLVADPRFSVKPGRRWPLIRALLIVLARSRAPLIMGQALLRPAAARSRVKRLEGQVRSWGKISSDASAADRLTKIEQLYLAHAAPLLAGLLPVFGSGLITNALASRLLKGLASPEETQAVLRALPHNATTQMDLALWSLAQKVRGETGAAQVLLENTPERLAQDYRQGKLPTLLQEGLAGFLRLYGHRGVAEIDMGLPRWSEDPSHILGVLSNYLQLNKAELAPDVKFRQAEQEAETMVAELARRASRKGRVRGWLVGLCLRRTRELAGLREAPKYYVVLLMAQIRSILWPVGEELARAGRLMVGEDVFFISLAEAREALSGKDFRSLVEERRATYRQELNRRHQPRVLLSDGTEPSDKPLYAGKEDQGEGVLRGTPASTGQVTARARVIFDPNGAYLEPGEILVAPSTDPGWTPLFMTAAGLVMEMGGPMSHGAVVAREYGIPAIVGVAGATELIVSGQTITIDSFNGIVRIDKSYVRDRPI